ncbi:MAG: ThuA domain-containing protein [Prosthecobacter sp.]|jgi:putative membrane-bound dehydrogenase-like protein|uniref:PVC-type heme-binding CxxCH protein n=1 Tax=Prosthecobacter sp. TaxID=1965333 RepID=UPI0019F93CF7|nr:PVC-type heme-binding CxxCH protein [Prosthecobacter sp.]MBE2285697.1 ThuA domain-containing protein [Prosthecobacter sp.]
MKRILLSLFTFVSFATAAPLVFEGTNGPGKGKHIVFMADDHEYRSEESLPGLARLLAKHQGFKCTVLFGIDKESGEIVAGDASNMPGIEALDTADLAVVFLRFQNFPPEQMKHFDDYLKRGGPVVGLRTATHGFKIPKDAPYAKYSFDYKGSDYELGFGHQVLGQTWVGHYGTNHKQSTSIAIVDALKQHPILRGVKDIWVQAGGYVGKPTSGEILTMAQPLNGMTPDSPADTTKPPMPSEWTRSYKSASGKEGRVFTSLYGTSEDITNDGYRRLLVNGIFWALGLEEQIKADLNIAFVGPFKPNTFAGGAYARGIKPEMYASWDSPIPANANTKKPEKPKKAEKAAAAASVDAKPTIATGKPARFVRIEIPGERQCIQIAEIEIVSGGKNIVKGGKATQSTTGHGGDASRAMDGDKSRNYGKGMTHTQENKPNPWWEVDLGSAQAIDSISLWSREGFPERLGGFTLSLLDDSRQAVFEVKNVAAGESLTIDVKGGGKVAYLTFDGKPGKPAVKSSGGGNSGPPEPTLVEVPADYKDTLPFAFSKGDVVAILGNGLPERMQHDGWMETVLQSALPEMQVRFRNMSTSGDRPNSYPRSPGQISMGHYLQHVKPDVVFGMFGYNESFENKPADFKAQLIEFVKKTRGTKPNGKSFPRIVLFSPIAHEDTRNPNVPDGKAHNAQLEAYTKATADAAGEAGVAFVDLFHPSLELFKAAKEPLTINGVHLTDEGNRQLAEVIAKALLGKEVSASASMEPLREAVVDKSYHWYQRYHASDGNDVWGSRSTLAFVDGQTNGVVLQHELSMLDVMTANRDERVWARINGGDKKIDDSNVPKPVEVKSNVGGGSKSSSAQKEGRLVYLDGEEAIKHMAVKAGFEVHLFADEKKFPQIANPVQINFDVKGRLWVAAWADYPKWEPLKESKDALLIVHDDNNDGKGDRITEFAKVNNPLGFEFWNGGVLVTRQSELLYLKDTDGDDKADVRIIMLQGLDSSDTHHGANNLIYGPDGGIYWQSGVFMQHNHEHPWGPSLQATSSAMYRFDPRRFTISKHADNSPNPHGTSFDYWGYHYATDGTGGRAYQVRPEGTSFKMYELLKKEVRPVTASEIVSSTHFPEDMQGDFLICNVIGFLGVKHYDLARDAEKATVWGEPAGDELVVKVTQADGTVVEEKARGFLMSGDKNFRPSDAVFAPDGSLYLADWQNVIIGHMQHNVRDPNRDHGHGRIYRITATGRELQKPVAIAGQPIPALLDVLKHPTDSIRQRARIELSARDSKEVMAATTEWIKQFDPAKKEDAHHLLEALWLSSQHNMRDLSLLARLQTSPEPHVRNAANVVQHLWFNVEATMKGGVLAGDVEEKIKVTIPPHLAKKDHELFTLGAAVFHRDAHCVTCHQPTGEGLLNVYPPLKGSPWVSGSEERLIKLTLNGLWGKIEVNGKIFDSARGVPPMTPFASLLNDKELAAVLTFVRNSWGNQAPAVAPETVTRIRTATKGRSMFWTPEELLKDHPLEK